MLPIGTIRWFCGVSERLRGRRTLDVGYECTQQPGLSGRSVVVIRHRERVQVRVCIRAVPEIKGLLPAPFLPLFQTHLDV